MSLSTDEILLQPIAYRRSIITHIWEEFSSYSVEAISSSHAGVYDFAEQTCMYFAVIKRFVKVPKPRDTSGGDGEENAYASASEDETDLWVPTTYDGSEYHTYESHSGSGKEFLVREDTIGVIYLTSDQLPGCVNMGCCILPNLRGRGYGTQAVRLVLGWAFDELGCHRIQVRIADGDPSRRNASIRLLLSQGFFSEGHSRRALFCPPQSHEERSGGNGGEYRDVLTYAMLDTDWVLQKHLVCIPVSLVKVRWEELFRRHEREREEMLTFEEHQERKARGEREAGKRPLKRSVSTETIKDAVVQRQQGDLEDVHRRMSHRFEDVAESPDPISPYNFLASTSSPIPPLPMDPDQDEALHSITRRRQTLASLRAYRETQATRQQGDSTSPETPVQDRRDSFTFIPSATRFRSTSPSASSVSYHSEDDFLSSPSSPLIPWSALAGAQDSGSESEWEGGSVPRSPSVAGSEVSSTSTSSWDMLD